MELKDETKTTGQDPLPEKGPASEGKEGSTSPAPKTYTEAEHQKAVSDALARAGRDAKSLETREARLKDIEAREKALKDREEEVRKRAEEEEARAAGNDPEKLSVLELRRKAAAEAEAVRAEREKLEADKLAFQERLSKAEELERAAEIDQIARKYQDGDPDKLKTLCEKLNLKSREQIEAAAETIFTRKSEGFKADSGVTKGGAVDYARMKPEDKFRLGMEEEKKRR
jgi:hypothetical protein